MMFWKLKLDSFFCRLICLLGHKQVQIAQAYEKNGAACLSVLTDQKYFQVINFFTSGNFSHLINKLIYAQDTCFPLICNQGSFDNLEAIRNAGVQVLCPHYIHTFDLRSQWYPHIVRAWISQVLNYQMQCPLLCKEFIVDAWQLYYARSKGADAVLLIAAVLPDSDIKYMLKICKILGMAALVEVSWVALAIYFMLFQQPPLVSLESWVIWFNDSTGLCYRRFMMKGK